MTPTNHYFLEALFYRKAIGNKLDFLIKGCDLKDYITHYQKEFRNDSSIIAKEEALSHFQSLIEVLYEGIGKKYTSDKQAEIDLQEYFNSGNDIEFGSISNKITVTDDLFNGINIYLVNDDPFMKEGKMGNKTLIRGINYMKL